LPRSYLEDQDMWWLPGIFREVTPRQRPAGGIDDLFVRADYRGTYLTTCSRLGRSRSPSLSIR
jgi:beta-galactosidase/beta-glucuronidase